MSTTFAKIMRNSSVSMYAQQNCRGKYIEFATASGSRKDRHSHDG